MIENIEDKLGQNISDVLMRTLKETFPNRIDPYKAYNEQDIAFIQGQQSIIDYLTNLKTQWDNNILK